jgi:hypothetical protein
MVETRLRWFGLVEGRTVDFVVVRVDQMEDSQITKGRGKLRKTIRGTIKKDLEINELDRNMVFDRTLWCNLIHVANLIWWDKAWLCSGTQCSFCAKITGTHHDSGYLKSQCNPTYTSLLF